MDWLWNPWTHKRLNQTAEKEKQTQSPWIQSMDSIHGIHGLTEFGREHKIFIQSMEWGWSPWIPDGINTQSYKN